MATPEEHKATVRRFEAGLGSADPAAVERTIDELVAPDVLIRTRCRSTPPAPRR
jgi:hypothetical protein